MSGCDEKQYEAACAAKPYEPALIKDGLNPHVHRSIRLWVWTSLAAFLLLCLCMLHVPFLSPRDPAVMERWLNERTIRCIYAFIALGFFTIFFEVKCNGNLLGQIIQTPMSSAVFLSAVFLGTVGLLVYV